MGHKMARNVCYLYIVIVRTYVPIYPITLNDYIYSPGKKIKKKKKLKKEKKTLNNFWGPCQVLKVNITAIYLKTGFQKTHFPMVLEVEKNFAVDLANF